MAWKTFVKAVCFVFIFSFVFQNSLSAKTLSLKQFVVEIAEKSHKIQSGASEVARDRLRYSEAKRRALPSVDLTMSNTKQSSPLYQRSPFNPTEFYNAEVSLTQAVYLGGRIWSGIKQKKIAMQLSELKQAEVQRQVFVNAIKLAVDYSLIKDQVAAIKQSIKTQSSFVGLTKKKLKRGNAKNYELYQNLSDLKSFESRLEQILVAEKAMAKNLRELLLLTDDEALVITLSKLPAFTGDLQQATQLALDRRPDLKISLKQLSMAEVQKSLELGAHLPSVNLVAGYGFNSQTSSNLFKSESQKDSITLAVSVPLFSGLSSFSARKAHQKNITASESHLHDKTQTVRVEVSNYYMQFKSAEKLLKLSREWKGYAEKALKDGMANFKRGVIGNVQVVQLQASRERAVLSYIASQGQYYKSYYELLAATGEDLKGI